MSDVKSRKKKSVEYVYYVYRVLILLAVMMLFLPAINPARISGLINKNMSLFTSGVSYKSLTAECMRPFLKGWVNESSFQIIFVSSMIMILGILLCSAAGCLSLGNNKCRRTGNRFSLIGSIVIVLGIGGILLAYSQISNTTKVDKVLPVFPTGISIFLIVAVIILLASIFEILMVPKEKKELTNPNFVPETYQMESKYKLFLMFLPFAVLAFVFSYLPLFGWRYAFFDYKSGQTLTWDKFVGFKWFESLFRNEATRRDVIRVIRNTLTMSGLGIATSWVPMMFAIFLSEIKNTHFKRFVQIFTTIPNFISWVLVYAIAFAIFSTEGFVNDWFASMGWITEKTNYLMGDAGIWFKMLGWGLWKGIGWSAIIYIAGISGIDQQLYEAATVDGAGRFQRMRHITIPGLLPTYCVLLLMSIAGVLSNGMDQYMVFRNATNTDKIMVLDLYIYVLGIGNGNIPLSTVIGMSKSIISVALLFIANRISKTIRGESII